MQIITIANQKGGSGKSTTAAALAQAAAHDGKRALLIDLDSQAGSSALYIGADAAKGTAIDLLEGKAKPWEIAQEATKGLFIIPGALNLAAEKTAPGSARRLAKALEGAAKHYDFIIIDTPPGVGEMQYNALQASTGLVIPLQAAAGDLQGLYTMTDTARKIQESNPALTIKGIVFTRNEQRSTISKQMRLTIIDEAAKIGVPYIATIRQGVALQEAQTLQESLFDYAPNSKPAADYMELYQRLKKNR